MKEHWKPIRNYEGIYAVSDQGRVKRVAHESSYVNSQIKDKSQAVVSHDLPECIIKIGEGNCVNLVKEGRTERLVVRSLVAEAFLRVPYGDPVTHLNGDDTDARLENLVPTSEFRKMDDENWRDIPGYEGLYQASRFGQIRSLDRYIQCSDGSLKFVQGVVREPFEDDNGYLQMALYKNGKSCTRNLHRFIAMAWIPNPENKRTVNHIDGNKHNNNVENLEWATYAEQQAHALATGLRKKSYWDVEKHGQPGGDWNKSRQIRVRCIETGVEYESYSEAGRACGCNAPEVKKSVEQHVFGGGYHFVKADEPDYTWGVEDLEGEVWTDIPGFEGLYQISNKDRVKSLQRTAYYEDGRTRTVPEKILKGAGNNSTYALQKDKQVVQICLNKIKNMTFNQHKKLFSIK